MTESVAIRAHEVALRRFLHEPSETSAELSQAKLLRRWISVMKLHRLRACGVTAIDALSTVRGDEIELSFAAPLSQRSAELFAASIALGFHGLLCRSQTEGHLRSVVVAERRALEAKASPI
jgi:hypothetical protein